MIKIMPMIEAFAVANIATQNLFGGNPIQVLLGDLNTSAGTGAYGALMGPQPGVITVKELLTGTMNTATSSTSYSNLSGKAVTTTTYGSTGGVLDAVAQNFTDNLGTIVVQTALTTAGFRIANKVLGKTKNKANKLLRGAGLGTTVQI
jgi:endonuclease/exonuclease/phosphatase family metal-dependent hydrolase|tara:strand:+ start:579 stop:1022 length:444 start_codon:yes stop_codon:yes gene_type:complete